jgi:hypothetical protein
MGGRGTHLSFIERLTVMWDICLECYEWAAYLSPKGYL